VVGAEAPTAGRPVEEAARAAEASASAAVAATRVAAIALEPSRNRKRGFLSLR
jgi:hypothetical protein